MAERLVTHLCRLREPAQIRSRYGTQVARALCEAAIDAVDACLALCVSGITARQSAPENGFGPDEGGVGLIDQAYLLVAGERAAAADRNLIDRLMRVAWSAYMLTGDTALVRPLSLLADELGGARPEEDRLTELYLETIPNRPEGLRLPSARHTDAESVVDHARARAGLFAEIVRPLVTVRKSTWLASAARDATSMLPQVLQRTSERAAERRGSPGVAATESLDYATLYLATLWQRLADNRGDGPARAFDASADHGTEIALERRDERSALGGRPNNFLLDGLLRQLVSAGNEAQRLDALHVIWQNLELPELSDLAVLGRSIVADDGDAGDGPTGYLVGLDGSDDRPINRIASELLAGIGRLGRNKVRAGVPLVQACSLSISGGIGSALTYELCKTVILSDIEGDQELREELVNAVLETPPGHPAVLSVEESEIPGRVLSLVNCLATSDSAPAERLLQEVVRRRDTLDNPWYADRVDQYVEYNHVGLDGPPKHPGALSALLQRWRTRVWDPGLPPSIAREYAAGEELRDVVYTLAGGDSPWSSSPGSHTGVVTCPPRPSDYDEDTRSTYAFVLQRVWEAPHRREVGMGEDAIRLLRGTLSPVSDRGYVILALFVCKELLELGREDSEDFSHALLIMRDGIRVVEATSRPATNRAIYEHLADYDSEHSAQYLPRAQYWRLQDELLEQENLDLHVAHRQYFEVFWHHFSRTRDLPCDMARDAVLQRLDAVNGQVPDALIFDGTRRPAQVSGEFLRLGHNLLHLRRDGGPHDSELAQVNDVARSNLRDLYTLIIEGTSLSADLRRFYKNQQERFDEV